MKNIMKNISILDIIVLCFSLIAIVGLVIYFRRSGKVIQKYENMIQDVKIVKHKVEDYEILEIFNLLTNEECDFIINHAKNKGLHESNVLSYGKESGIEVNDNYRKSKTCWIKDDEHHIFTKIAQITEQFTNIPIDNQEMLQVAHYEPNGKFNEHYDACVYNDKEYCDKMNNYAGQRRSTLLMYLNDDFKGGETEFVDIGVQIKPEKGKAIFFWNVDENETLYVKSKHRANPVIEGEKWICTKWSHVRPYNK